MKKLRILSLVMALALCFGLLAGCGGDTGANNSNNGSQNNNSGSQNGNSDSQGNGSQSGEGEITIALIGNTTGDYAQYGVPVRNGAMLYIDQLNANGGINGKTINVLEYDDKGDGIEAMNAFNLAMDRGATAVIGSVLTGATTTLAETTYSLNVPQITASATAAGVTVMEDGEVRTNVFRACFIDPFQGEKMADYAYEKLNAKTAAILYQSGSDYSEGLKDAFIAKAGELGIQVLSTEGFAEGDKDFNAQMTKIAGQNPDVVFMPIYYGEAGTAITQGRQAGLTAVVLGGDGWGSVKNYATAEDLEGSVYCSGYAPGSEPVAQFEADYEEAYGETVPNMFAPLAYDAAMLMCEALKAAEDAGLEAGTPEYMQAVIEALAATDGLEGITGAYTFDEFNNPIKSAAMIELKNGEEVFTEFY